MAPRGVFKDARVATTDPEPSTNHPAKTHPTMKSLFAVLLVLVAALSGASAQETPLAAGQTLMLKLAGVPADEQAAISGQYTVSDGGTISLLYIPEIRAVGLRPSELARRIESAYRSAQIYTKPNVTINLERGAVDRFVTVMGEVNSAGQVPYTPGLTMLAAIAQRGDFSDFGDSRDVKLTRGGQVTYHNLSRAASTENATLQPGDLIVVGKRGLLR